jgi:hypothetical protein
MPPVPLPEGKGSRGIVVVSPEPPELPGIVVLPPELAGRSELPGTPCDSGLLALPDGVLEG